MQADADGVAIVVIAVAVAVAGAADVVVIIASTLFTDDLLYNRNINKNNENIKWIYRTVWN